MYNGALVTLAGHVVKEPSLTLVGNQPKVTIRVAWNPRYRDRVTGEWKDGATSFANVECWRNLANNVKSSLSKGNAVLVTGKLQVREFEDREGHRRISVEIYADSIGHDLSRAVTHLLRGQRRPDADGGEQPDCLAPGEVIGPDQDGSGALTADGAISAEVFNADAVAGLAGETNLVGEANLAGETKEPVTAAAPF
ncbi:MAG TPA: single-stranded DNA-binding protein [Streptosporangiaceae bacterium]|jgi:single-strand DNA-binding protein